MASTHCDDSCENWVWDGAFGDLIANASDAVVLPNTPIYACDPGLKYHDIVWSKPVDHKVWPDFTWHSVDLDVDSIVGVAEVKTKPENEHRDLLWDSIDGLEPSSLSRLFRVIRDWNSSAAEEAPLVQLDLCEPTHFIEPAEPVEFRSPFLTLIEESHHKLLKREADKDLWTWFSNWRNTFLSLAERFSTLSGDEVVNLLKKALAATRRSVPKSRAPRQRKARAERLVRLADSIAPNAPPFSPPPQALPTGAG
ncbi:MAG TPA: hypothetical protein VFZ29_00960 [Solirubrobacterales bacterium]